jgi:hypothetical protein
MQNLYSILKSNLLSGFIGSMVGGLVTWLVTKNSLKKQFEYQKEIIELTQKQQEKLALKSVKNEIKYNLYYLNNLKRILTEQDMSSVNSKVDGLDLLFKQDKWLKHSDIIENIDDLDCLSLLHSFYVQLIVRIQTINNTDIITINDCIEIGNNVISSIEDTITRYEL